MTATAPGPDLSETIARNVAHVRARIARAARDAGRDPESIRLIAVSKTFPIGHIQAAMTVGLTEFGENRVQEALQKIDQTAEQQIKWHLIGHLQSNKARRAAGAFSWIHSVDSVELLERLDIAATEQSAAPRLLVQVDLAGETTKYGATEPETRRILEAASSCRAARVSGLMVIPPWSDDPERTRPYFRRLQELRTELRAGGVGPEMLAELSMGMSHDLEVAIAEGATMVRVGTAIFGRRTPPSP